MDVPADADILDVGCGTGASCVQLMEALPKCRVWGLDNSPAMLETARSMINESDRLSFVEGDAARLADYFRFKFDAVIYSASIFLIPDFKESLRQANDLLKKGGRIGLSFMDGLYDPDGNNLLEIADQEAKEGVSLRRPVTLPEFKSFFAEMFPGHKFWQEDFRLPKDLLREFLFSPRHVRGTLPGLRIPGSRGQSQPPLRPSSAKRSFLFRWILIVGERLESV